MSVSNICQGVLERCVQVIYILFYLPVLLSLLLALVNHVCMSVQQDYAFGQRQFVYVLLTYVMSTKISLSMFSALLLEFNPLITNDVFRRHLTLMQLPGEIPI